MDCQSPKSNKNWASKQQSVPVNMSAIQKAIKKVSGSGTPANLAQMGAKTIEFSPRKAVGKGGSEPSLRQTFRERRMALKVIQRLENVRGKQLNATQKSSLVWPMEIILKAFRICSPSLPDEGWRVAKMGKAVGKSSQMILNEVTSPV